MRTTALTTVLCLTFGCVCGRAAVAAPVEPSAEPAAELSVDVPTILADTPLRLAVHLGGEEHVPAVVLVDGREVGTATLAPGDNEVSLPGAALAGGTHELVLRAGGSTVVRDFRVLPGWLSVLPPLLAIALALLTRDVLISLFLGVFGGAFILYSWNPFTAFGRTIDHFIVPALADPDHASILVFTTLLGGMVGLITKGGGTHGVVERLTPYATSQRRGQLATWLMGVLVFFDDYANTLIVGPTMRPITDKLRISREKLAYIVDSTAAPVVCLFPISTWVGFEIGLIGDAMKQVGLPYDAYSTFIATIPYRFYPIFALILVFTLAATQVDFGPMRRAEARAMRLGKLQADDARPIADYSSQELEPPPDIPKRALNAVLPIVTVVAVTVLGLYITGAAGQTRAAGEPAIDWIRRVLESSNSYHALLWSSLAGLLVALLLPAVQRLVPLRDAMVAMLAGFRAMLLALLVLTLAWALSAVCGELQTAEYMVGLAHATVTPHWLPALTFVLAAAIAFATGSSWGTMAILEPLVIPICHNLSLAVGHDPSTSSYHVFLYASIASVLAGSVWGDHCSPISDTTILSSMASGCDHIAHVRTQLPYALTAGALAVGVGSVPAAYEVSPWISLLIGLVVIAVAVPAYGRWQDRRDAASAASEGGARRP